ncbi:YhcB family protein [Colwellia sp. MEBiC06753]
MTAVMTIVLLLIGGGIGFVAGRFLSASSKENKQLTDQIQQSEAALSQYQNDVAAHLESSAQLLAKMNETCQVAMKQMEESTSLLQRATPQDADVMPFFSQETQEQLAETVKLRHEKKAAVDESVTEAPLDYSGQASGLFGDKKQSVTNAD